jgi:hypothetical protein
MNNLPKHTSIFQDGGKHNERCIHNQVVSRIFLSLGDEAWGPSHGLLSPILSNTSQISGIPTSTCQRWYKHFLLYGETIPETRLWEKEGFIRKEVIETTKWKQHHTTALQSIVTERPWLYLDEIQSELLAATSTCWAASTIYERMQ